MFGAVIGDIIGSTYEFKGIKQKNFILLPRGSMFTDDSILTIAIGDALISWKENGVDLKKSFVENMLAYARAYPYPLGGYGSRFVGWIKSENHLPYNSYGNGSAMRVSPCALIAESLDEALDLAKQSAEVTHNHPEGIKGAQATAAAIYLAKTGEDKDNIRTYIRENFYPLNKTLDEIRPDYCFDRSCQGTVPESIQAFLESTSYEDAIRNTISLGGDADTMGAITGSIAWAYYGRNSITSDMEKLLLKAEKYIPEELIDRIVAFRDFCNESNERR